MVQKFRQWCPVEVWRLLVIMGTMFAVIIIFQHFEFPYGGSILSSMSSAPKDVVGGSNRASSDLELVGNATRLNGMNSTGSNNAAHEGGDEESGRGVDADVGDDIAPYNGEEPSVEPWVNPPISLTMDQVSSLINGSVPEGEEQGFPVENVTSKSVNSGTLGGGIVPALPPGDSAPNKTLTRNVEPNVVTQDAPVDPKRASTSFSSNEKSGELPNNVTTLPGSPTSDSPPNITFTRSEEDNIVTQGAPVVPETAAPSLSNYQKSGEQPNNITTLQDSPSTTTVPKAKKEPEKPISEVLSISDMNTLLLQRWSSPNSVRPRWPSAVDQELLEVKSLIKNAPIVENDPVLSAPLFHNLSIFKRSYDLMEEKLKVYVYKEGEKPIIHQPVLQGIYASEGWFMRLMEANKQFVTKNPKKAHLFYLPFSSRKLEEILYVPDSHNHHSMIQYLRNYLHVVTAKYPFWNRTRGADHFLVACHDWAPSETREIMSNCIRALCNNDIKEGFVFGKDVSLPETIVINPRNPTRDLGGKPPSKRSILAFFAGSMHGYVRPILLEHWQNKDPDMKIFGRLPKLRGRGKMNYANYMKSSKYCICAKGYEVNSPRVVEAIFYECVPVILSDNFVPPFLEVLNWESFAVFVKEKDIPNLKNILLSIPEKRYREMQRRVKQVQKHFLWHARPEKYDLFHMILHSIWYTRVFQTWAY
ncbi:hypothetical protein Tsubulata_038939 [Turnera subulata]|uniref:Exostosin GT47 domain-containing protein n=1 Tax=Turnera subulata TaxID=218843 RepID=A0A9Q0GHX9_9ROSI|nr:hypothetical protein Tsubulata_038939 [Turnera subulata]